MLFIKHKSIKGNNKCIESDKKFVVVGGVLAGGLGLGDTVVGLVGVLIGLLHLGRCLGASIVVGLSEGGIVVVGGNVVVKALGGKVDVVVCMCGNIAVGGIVGVSVKVAVVVLSVLVARLLWVVLSLSVVRLWWVVLWVLVLR